jgi:hypothetical protein
MPRVAPGMRDDRSVEPGFQPALYIRRVRIGSVERISLFHTTEMSDKGEVGYDEYSGMTAPSTPPRNWWWKYR